MTESKRCRKVQKLISALPDCESGPTVRVVLEHISKCDACRTRHAILQKLEAVLSRSRLQVDESARESWLSRRRFLIETAPLPRKRAWCLRPVPVGAAAILLAIVGAAVFFLFDKGGHAPPIARPPVTRAPAVTQTTAAEHASRTLLRVAAVLRRREAPAPGLPGAPGSVGRASFFPRLLQESALGSDETLGRILMSRINLTRRNHL